MSPVDKFAARLRRMSDGEASLQAWRLADLAGIPAPVGKSGKTTLRIVARQIRLSRDGYEGHRAELLDQIRHL